MSDDSDSSDETERPSNWGDIPDHLKQDESDESSDDSPPGSGDDDPDDPSNEESDNPSDEGSDDDSEDIPDSFTDGDDPGDDSNDDTELAPESPSGDEGDSPSFTKSMEDDEDGGSTTPQDSTNSQTSDDEEVSEGNLKERLSDDGHVSVTDFSLPRRSLLAGSVGGIVALFGGGFAAGSFFERHRLKSERKNLKERREEIESELQRRREQLKSEYIPPTSDDQEVLDINEDIQVPRGNFKHYYLKFDQETLLTYDISADSYVDMMVLTADEFASYRSKRKFNIRDKYSELDTTTTKLSEVLPAGWYVFVIDNSSAGKATPDKTRKFVEVDVDISAYQQKTNQKTESNRGN